MSIQLSSKASVGALLNDSVVPASSAAHPSLHYPMVSQPQHHHPQARSLRASPPRHAFQQQQHPQQHSLQQQQPTTIPTPVSVVAQPSPQQQNHSNPANSAAPKKKHVCSICNKGFTTSGHLARHTRVHTGERNHKCPFPGCETRCSRQDNLQQHYRIHLSPGSRRSSSSATRAAMNRAYESAQQQAQQHSSANGSSSSPEINSPNSATSGPPLSANPISPLSPASTASPNSGGSGINPLNSAMVSGGGGATHSSASSINSASSRAQSPDYKRPEPSGGSLQLLNAPMSAPPSMQSGNALGLHSVPSPHPGSATNNHSYQQPERLSLSFPHQHSAPQQTPTSSQQQAQNHNYFTLRPAAFNQHSHSHTHSYNSASHPNSTQSTPHLSHNQLSGGTQNSPVSPAASLSTAPSPVSQFTPVRQPSISSYPMSNHSSHPAPSHTNTLNSHSLSHHNHHHVHPHHSNSSFSSTNSPPPRLPPITTQPHHQNMSSYSSPVPRSQTGYPYSMYPPSGTYGPPASLSAMSMATMGPVWKDGLAMHGGNNSTISPIGAHGYHGDMDHRRR